MMAQPLDKGLAPKIEFMAGQFSGISEMLTSQFGWDELTADSIWAFGPNNVGSNLLVDYSLGFETDKNKLN